MGIECGARPDVAAAVATLAAAQRSEAEAWARAELLRLPTPLFAPPDDPLRRRREALQLIAAHLASLDGRPEELIDCLRAQWLRGDSVLPLLRALREAGHSRLASTTARLAAFSAEDAEAEAIETFLEQDGNPPEGWQEAIRDFAKNPSLDGWSELVQFIPLDHYYYRIRAALRLLRRLGVAPTMLFRLATQDGVTPEAVDLVESGLVSPAEVLEAAQNQGPASQPLWLGLAARAAFADGDMLGTVRYLKAAYSHGDGRLRPDLQASDIRAAGDDALNEALDRAGVPHFDDRSNF